MPRVVQSDYNGYFLSVSAEPDASGKWKPKVHVDIRLGDALVPRVLEAPGLFDTEDAAVDSAVDWVRKRIDERQVR
jgi:hypothetical protein